MAGISATTIVRVRDYPVLADIGINPDEIGRRQPLVVNVEVEIAAPSVSDIEQTLDYRWIVSEIDALALVHIPLIETFAHRLGEKCVGMDNVTGADISIDKPFAITRGMAGTRVQVRRD
ncbi:dihydroneopterin aldolase [Paraurantiacibacter namhicola]|uniref:D-erythro-7,8-dihydroneopterin triphosphate 2'-epimerase n=1 Tax=Paraurantiacibacter namhicola TaxID=645517 RepID=A0A1C7D4T4_9SPHN|nr:dihydroneopterin aldolase [Paraurantiacibacter namhicola]ANU06470.1 D-erythro-7,8-dihydroneopterin triphosphate 2'-epimerase [Paraurantiacibacter namhicola]